MIVLIMCGVCLPVCFMGLWVCGKDLCKCYQLDRQENQRRREYENKYCKPNSASGKNLGIFGKPNLESKVRALPLVALHAQISKISENLVCCGRRKPIMLLELTGGFGNLLWCLSFCAHKSNDVAKQPNDPKLSHGANNCKRGFANKRKMKEQSPLAPARC